ncbi:MAG: PAS domain S-box protein [Pedobacter sp.]|nr:MAG: PAS domain S-box protein [Pedobacter sp.]
MLSTSSTVPSANEDDRIRALHQYDILDTPEEVEFNNIVKLAALVCNMPNAMFSLVDEDRLYIKSMVGGSAHNHPRETSFSHYTIQSEGLMEIKDTLLDERFANHRSVIESPFVRYYAGAPLIDDNGFKLGVIGVFDTKPGSLTDEQKEGLKILGKEIITHLSLRKKKIDLVAENSRFEELLRLSTVSPEIHCILDDTGIILFINDAVTGILEYSPAEATGLSMWDFCFEEDRAKLLFTLKNGLRNHAKEFSVDFRIVSKTGIVRWLSWNMVVRGDRWYTYGRDITDSKRVEDELMKLSFVASKVDNAVVINNANNHVTWVNAAFEKITGYTLEDLKGKRLGDLIIGPETDLELLAEAREMIKRNLSFTVDLLAYKKDKTPIWLSIYNTVVLNEDGEVDIEVEIIIDITEKKNAEEEVKLLSLVASKTDTGVNITDREGNTTWVNRSLEKLIGYSLEEIQGRKLGDIIANDESQRELISASRMKAENNESYSIEVKASTKEGKPIWVSVANTPVVDEKATVIRQIDLITDITQRKQVERELVESKEQALQLSEAKEMFLSVMSHEIRTPLNAVIGMTHLLLDNDPKVSQIDDLNILKFSAENLLNIINDILDFTKIETGNLVLESVPIDIKSLAGDIISSLQINAAKRSNALALNVLQIPDLVMGDKTRLYQILMNLLGNAIKFTRNGHVNLNISLAQENDTEVQVLFEVQDNGIGIPEDKLSYIFEAFTQAKSDISRKYGGTGLGLAITKKLLKLYNSDIIVKSEEGLGTTFSFTVAFKKLSAHAAPTQNPNEISSFAGKSILVVDDNEINILIANRILSKMGFVLEFASNGHEAIQKVVDQRFDLVFMDIKMPGIDGYETTSIIRGLEGDYFKQVPIIALTASTLQDDITQFKASGMNGHVLKPFKPEEIKAVINQQFSKV